ncbi:MAG: hypothetical protein ABIP48_17860 [Planctomycetota bacterium]
MTGSSDGPKKLPRAIPLEGPARAQSPARPLKVSGVRPASEGGPESFDFADLTRDHQQSLLQTGRRRRPSPLVPALVVVLIVAAIGAGLAFWLGRKEPLDLKPLADYVIDEETWLGFTAVVENPGKGAGRLRYSLRHAPEGARIDSRTGEFTWRPTEEQAPGQYAMTVRVEAPGTKTIPAERPFEVIVREVGEPRAPKPFKEKVEGPAQVATKDPAPAVDPIVPKEGAEAMKTDAMTPPAEETADQTAQAPQEDRGDEIILELHEKNRLLSKPEYPTLRSVFAGRFENEHAEEIGQAFGEEDGPMRKWLESHVDIKEEFYLAIDPEHDEVLQALTLFKELKDRFPEKFEEYANLAIAVAVVWDKPRGAIQGSPCEQHQSLPPEGEVGAVENFEYFLDTENVMQGRAQFLPWEFLVHMVNHRTPLVERHWALTMYLPKRSMFGKCYDDVPYDDGLLGGRDPKLKEKPHTLANLLRYGGVCTARADYAGRVGKSIGVPAFSVGGQSRYGEGHGWVMWAELGQVTRTGFTFSLESHGRFRGDRYYIGNLNDPHTGQPTTDRDVERRLHTVGMDPVAKRQADLVMRSYPMLRERTEMDTTKQLLFLSRLLDFSPGNEEAWIALAKMSREGQITKTNSKPMGQVLNRLFTTFASLPDFTWVVFDDLVSFQDIPKQRAALFGRLAAMYEQAGRPDLSCEARLKFAEYLVADERLVEAIQGLGVAILLFPEEGNFVPKMLGRLEALARQHGDGQKRLVGFYQEFLPKISQKRQGSPSPYCIQMYKRGILQLQAAGADQLARLYQAQLAALEAQ